jgi:hypothetical protein
MTVEHEGGLRGVLQDAVGCLPTGFGHPRCFIGVPDTAVEGKSEMRIFLQCRWIMRFGVEMMKMHKR